MKTMKNTIKIILILIAGIILVLNPVQVNFTQAETQGKSITVLFTHDTHDNLLPFKTLKDGKIENDIVFISHGDCEDDARFVADLIKERFGIQKFLINYICPTIGAHSGPGTVALFFMGNER